MGQSVSMMNEATIQKLQVTSYLMVFLTTVQFGKKTLFWKERRNLAFHLSIG